MLNIGIIGLGYWGPNYLRVFNESPGCKVSWCCDLDRKNLDKAKKISPRVKVTGDYKKVADDPEIDAVVIVTPVNTHYQIAKYFLKQQKHVLLEKPFTVNSSQAQGLLKAARDNHVILMIGHVYLYNSGISVLKEFIKSKALGEIYYLKAERVGLGPIRKHASALWDLATHDISIMLHLLDLFPEKVSAQGASYLQDHLEDFVNINLKFPGNVYGTIYASWFAPEKIRKLTVVGSCGMAVFDDVNKQETLKIYERKVDKSLLNSSPEFSDHQKVVVMGKVYIPDIKQVEPLKAQAEHFLECIRNKKQPLTDSQNGLDVVKVLEKAERTLKKIG